MRLDIDVGDLVIFNCRYMHDMVCKKTGLPEIGIVTKVEPGFYGKVPDIIDRVSVLWSGGGVTYEPGAKEYMCKVGTKVNSYMSKPGERLYGIGDIVKKVGDSSQRHGMILGFVSNEEFLVLWAGDAKKSSVKKCQVELAK